MRYYYLNSYSGRIALLRYVTRSVSIRIVIREVCCEAKSFINLIQSDFTSKAVV